MAAIFFIVGTSYRDVLRSAYCNSGDGSRRVARPEALNGVLWTYPSAKVHLGILACPRVPYLGPGFRCYPRCPPPVGPRKTVKFRGTMLNSS
jgi:hypothetical protein